MARGVNKVILIGNLGNAPEVRYTQNNNSAIANLSIATSESWVDKKTNQRQDRTEWHRVVIFGKLAEIAGQYLSKGSKVYIEGKLRTRKWQDQSGQDRYSTEVVVDIEGQMQMLDNRENRAPDMQANMPQNQSFNQYQNSAPQANIPHQSVPNQQPSNNYQQNSQHNQNNQQGNNQSYNNLNNQQSTQKPNNQASINQYDDFDDDIPF